MFTEKFTSAVLALIASGTILAFSAGPAQAASVEVRAPQTQLATVGGRSAIDARLMKAAERVCRADEAQPLSDYAARKACAAATLANARAHVAQVSSAMQMAAR